MLNYRRFSIMVLGAQLILFPLLYSNCAQVNFGMGVEAIRKQMSLSGSIVINDGDQYTREKSVRLSLEHNSAVQMYVTNDPTCEGGGAWEPYTTSRDWQLGEMNKSSFVYVKFRESGVDSECYKDDIVHDDVAPQINLKKSVAEFINTASTDVQFEAIDAVSGVRIVNCETDGKALAGDCPRTNSLSGLTEGSHSVKIVAIDNAGNKSAPVVVPFTVDLTAPTIVINSQPPKVTAETEGQFNFSGSDTLSGIASYQCRTEKDVSFKPCTSPLSQVYTEGPHTFYVQSIDKAGNLSPIKSYEWTVDLTAPYVRITAKPPEFTKSREANFAFIGFDGSTPISNFECSVDGGAFGACSGSGVHNIPLLAAGSHRFAVRGKDGAGNPSAPAEYTWLVDLTPPRLTILDRPLPVSNNTRASYPYTASDSESGLQSVQCRLDGASLGDCAQPAVYPSLADGSHTFEIRAIDKAGNLTQETHTFRVDTLAPTVTITSGPASLTKSNSAVFQFTGSDPGGGRLTYQCRIGNGIYETCSSPTSPYMSLPDGNYVFTVRAIDEAGNSAESAPYRWTIDTTGPAINFSKQPTNPTNFYMASEVRFTVTDDGSGLDLVRCGLDGNMADCAATEQFSFKPPMGAHSFKVTAKDKLGNLSELSVDWQVVNQLERRVTKIDVLPKKVDVLIVIDNSGSMKTEQANMAERFGSFIDKLAGFDWQIAIVTTDISSNAQKKDGRFLEFAGMTGTFILNSKMDLAAAKTAFGRTIQRPASEGSGDEQGIGATYRSVQRALDTGNLAVNAPNRAFFRDRVPLSVIVVSDADETSPNGTQTYNVPANLLDLVRTSFPSKSFTWHSIIVPVGDEACLKTPNSGNEGYGYTYTEMSRLTGGTIGKVCETDYAQQLGTLGGLVSISDRTANLDCAPVDRDGNGQPDIEVATADGSAAPAHVIEGQKITFERSLPLGENSVAYYCPAATVAAP